MKKQSQTQPFNTALEAYNSPESIFYDSEKYEENCEPQVRKMTYLSTKIVTEEIWKFAIFRYGSNLRE